MKYKQTLLLIATFLTTPVYAVCTNVTNYHLADIAVTCTSSTDAYKLGINIGSYYTGSRQLAHAGGQSIPYTLFHRQ